MTLELLTEHTWAERCAADGEFHLAASHWQGGLILAIGGQRMGLTLRDGEVTPGAEPGPGVVEYSGDVAVWTQVLKQTPPRFCNDLMANLAQNGGLARKCDPVVHAQYYAAIMRAVELLRPTPETVPLRAGDVASMGTVDAPVGRYVHLQLGGHDHRIYFETAGQGIPLLLQHTAGCHGSQWRHLFETPEITSRFKLIAYDLPCHGKSLPPLETTWWAQPYELAGEFLRSVPLALIDALQIGDQRPVFAGCSVGGLLALDLAHKHPDVFRAVVSVEGALNVEGDLADLGELWHPQVNNEYKARLMEGLMSPTSPKPYRKETSFVYASGWPPAFLGDLYYYVADFDLRTVAAEIDTGRVAVHILSGEYDYSGTSEMGRAAHQAIAGSTWTEMPGVGHFPMSENPEAFVAHLLPVLDAIAAA